MFRPQLSHIDDPELLLRVLRSAIGMNEEWRIAWDLSADLARSCEDLAEARKLARQACEKCAELLMDLGRLCEELDNREARLRDRAEGLPDVHFDEDSAQEELGSDA